MPKQIRKSHKKSIPARPSWGPRWSGRALLPHRHLDSLIRTRKLPSSKSIVSSDFLAYPAAGKPFKLRKGHDLRDELSRTTIPWQFIKELDIPGRRGIALFIETLELGCSTKTKDAILLPRTGGVHVLGADEFTFPQTINSTGILDERTRIPLRPPAHHIYDWARVGHLTRFQGQAIRPVSRSTYRTQEKSVFAITRPHTCSNVPFMGEAPEQILLEAMDAPTKEGDVVSLELSPANLQDFSDRLPHIMADGGPLKLNLHMGSRTASLHRQEPKDSTSKR